MVALQTFVLAMVSRPDVISRAQRERPTVLWARIVFLPLKTGIHSLISME